MGADHMVQSLVDRLPVMSSGKPRRFRLWCECYEWTFNLTYKRYHRPTPEMIATECGHVTRVADALFEHQRANPELFALPKAKARRERSQ